MSRKRPVLLLVEDNQMLRRTLRRYLEQHLPVEVIEATSAADAVATALRHEPELVLLDLTLPDEPGLAIISRLRSSGSSPRVVVMGDYRDRQLVDEVTAQGAWAYVAKESLGSELASLIREAVRADETVTRRATAPTGVPARCVAAVGRGLARGAASINQGIHWLDANGPWTGKPRTRLLYLANVVELALVIAVKHHSFGM